MSRTIIGIISVGALGLFISACAGLSVCERKAQFLTTQCAGKLSVQTDPTCEAKTRECTPAQKQQHEGYVSCLEAAGQCSQAVMSACQERFPGGVNLVCG